MSAVVLYVVFDNATGRILRYGACPQDQIAIQAQSGQTAIESSGTTLTHYWNGSAIVARAPMPDITTAAPVGVSTVLSVGLPNPTVVTLSHDLENPFPVTSGVLEVTFPITGIYQVTLDAGVTYVEKLGLVHVY